jgi:hypothetical protein
MISAKATSWRYSEHYSSDRHGIAADASVLSHSLQGNRPSSAPMDYEFSSRVPIATSGADGRLVLSCGGNGNASEALDPLSRNKDSRGYGMPAKC